MYSIPIIESDGGKCLEMTSSNLARWGGIGAVVAGLIYVVLVLLNPQSLVGLSPLPSSLSTLMFILALLGQLAGIAGLHTLQREHYGRLGAAGSLISFAGFVVQLIAVLGIAVVSSIILALLFAMGVLIPFVGLVLLGVATLRTRVLPSWLGVLLIVGLPIVGVLVGLQEILIAVIAYGVFWMLVGYALSSSEAS